MDVATPERPAVATLVPGTDVEGVFACTRKDRLSGRSGRPYLALELRDSSGRIPARAFRDVDFLAEQFERGDLVWVSGRVERFRDELQIELRAIRRAEPGSAEPEAFLPVAYRDLDELDGFLEHLAREVHDDHYRRLLHSLLGDDHLRASVRRAPCTAAGHHAYLGGLLEHTVAVASLAQEVTILHPGLDSDLLMTAAIVHDLGKTREFELGAAIRPSEEGRLLGHLVIGHRIVSDHERTITGYPAEKALALAHCVLSHHGPDGLPGRQFASPEALTLHRLNALDAGAAAALTGGLRA